MYTLDASIFVRDLNPREPNHAICRDLLERLAAQQIPIIAPALLRLHGRTEHGCADRAVPREDAASTYRSPFGGRFFCAMRRFPSPQTLLPRRFNGGQNV
jgi:predicted nucleic acid-binding protein